MGRVQLILHAHIPYVHVSRPEALEERWLFEALTETYLPLLGALASPEELGAPRLALSFSPPLLAALSEPERIRRCRAQIERLIALAASDRACAPEYRHLPDYYAKRYRALLAQLDAIDGDVLAAFKALDQSGRIELFTAAGTHPFLPYLASRRMQRAHVEVACAAFAHAFGRATEGLWLPECAYEPGLDTVLAACGITWSVVATEALQRARPLPPGGVYRPVLTPMGVAVFARAAELCELVWSSAVGYPGAAEYREFYRDIGYDRPLAQLRDVLIEGRVRADTGLKYHRVTAAGIALGDKAPYDPAAAGAAARRDAGHFAGRLRDRLAALASESLPGDPLITLAFDTELFGHWWFEGPEWLSALGAAAGAAGVEFTLPSAELARNEPLAIARLPFSTWGAGGDGSTWLQPKNAWVYPELHAAEHRLAELASGPTSGARRQRTAQAAGELMLAQASDWAFLMARDQAGDYAERRTREHLAAFAQLAEMPAAGRTAPTASRLDTASVARLVAATADEPARAPVAHLPFFPDLDFDPALVGRAVAPAAAQRIVMLSWEYPPHAVGGLGRHVEELARAMVRRGCTVSVICPAQGDEPVGTTAERGVDVHRVRVPATQSFLDGIDALNQQAARWALANLDGVDVRVIHAHDWLVARAAQSLALAWHRPLVATIHATERGRVKQIREPLQQIIHEEELLLAQAAERVITVSRAMAEEITAGFGLDAGRTQVIYNGIDAATLWTPAVGEQANRLRSLQDAPLLVFVGRLVHEKGVDVFLEACARLAAHRDFRAVVMGRGDQLPALKALAERLGVGERVTFTGFVTDLARAAYLRAADIGVVPSRYEPFGIVALEVMAAGCAVVASATGGLAEVVESETTGLLVPPGDADALAAALDRLLADDTLRTRLGEAALADVRAHWGWDEIARQTDDLYRGLG